MAKTFSKSPIRELMKKEGAEIVSSDAIDTLIDKIDEYAKKITNKALELARHASRKKLTAEDIRLASTL